MKKFLAVLALLILLAAVAGCKEDVAAKDTTTGPAASDDAEEEGSADVEAEEESEGGFFDKFSDVVSAKMGTKYMVQYKFTATNQEDQIDSLTHYFGGPDKFRMDTETARGGGRVYILSSGFYSCTQQAAEWQCIKMGDSTGMDPSEQFKAVEENPESYDIKSDGTKMVAGTLAKCFKITMKEGVFRECFSKEGVPLYMNSKVTAGGQTSEMEMTATKYSTSVKESDFTLPAEAIDLQAMYSQAGRGSMPEGYDPSAYENMDAADYSDE